MNFRSLYFPSSTSRARTPAVVLVHLGTRTGIGCQEPGQSGWVPDIGAVAAAAASTSTSTFLLFRLGCAWLEGEEEGKGGENLETKEINGCWGEMGENKGDVIL